MIWKEATTEVRIGELEPVYFNITWDLMIDIDGCVIPQRAVIWNNVTKRKMGSVDAAYWWDFLTAKEQDEIIREIMENEKDPADEWDFNDSGNPKMFQK